MNEQSQKVLTDLLQKASNGIDSAVSFSQAQIPDVVHQLLVWNFTTSLIFSVLGIGILLLSQYIAWRAIKYFRTVWEGDDLIDHPEVAFYITAYLLSWAFAAWINLTWLKIWLAPKLYLIEYAASLVK